MPKLIMVSTRPDNIFHDDDPIDEIFNKIKPNKPNKKSPKKPTVSIGAKLRKSKISKARKPSQVGGVMFTKKRKLVLERRRTAIQERIDLFQEAKRLAKDAGVKFTRFNAPGADVAFWAREIKSLRTAVKLKRSAEAALKRSAARIAEEKSEKAIKREKKAAKLRESAARAQTRADIRRFDEGIVPQTTVFRLDQEGDINDRFLIFNLIRQTGLTTNVRVLYFLEGEIRRDIVYPRTSGTAFRNALLSDWLVNEYDEQDLTWMGEDIDERKADISDMVIIIQPDSSVDTEVIEQRFLDGKIDHCVCDPIIRWAENMLIEAQKKTNVKKRKGPTRGVQDKKIFAIPKRTRQMYNAVIKKATKWKKNYPNGLTPIELQLLCDDINVNITVDDVFSIDNKGATFLIVNSTKGGRKTFNFINTRFNHLEISVVVQRRSKDAIILSPKQMEDKFNELMEGDIVPLYGKDGFNQFIWIATCLDYYRVKTETSNIYERFYEDLKSGALGTSSQPINANYLNVSYAEKYSKLIRSAAHQCGQHNFDSFIHIADLLKENPYLSNSEVGPNWEDHYVRLDQKNAYANFNSCDYYQGFMSTVHEFRNVYTDNKRKFLMEHVGIFFVENVSLGACEENTKAILEDMEVYTDEYNVDNGIALISPELLFMLDIGITFDLKYGCWSLTPFKFEFPDYMYGRENDKSPRWYQKIIGNWGSVRESVDISMTGPKKWVGHLRSSGYYAEHYANINSLGDEIDDKGTIVTRFQKEDKRIKHKNGMAAFICGYQRIGLLQQTFKFNIDDIFAIRTDEIVVRAGTKLNLINSFRDKNSHKRIDQRPGHRFMSQYEYPMSPPDSNIWHVDGLYFRGVQVSDDKKLWAPEGALRLHHGQGGSGKSHSILVDPGWMKIIYCAPSHKLRMEKQEQFPDVRTEVHYNVLEYPRRSEYEYGSERKDIYVPSVLIFDEGLTADKFKQARKIYPYAVIIILQDVNIEKGFCYQLPNLRSNGIPAEQIDWGQFVTIEYTNNRRAKCEKLKDILKWYRNEMEISYTASTIKRKGYWSYEKVTSLKGKLLKKLKDNYIKREDVKSKYKLHDYVLVGRRVDRKPEKIIKLKEELAAACNVWEKNKSLSNCRQFEYLHQWNKINEQLKLAQSNNYKPGTIYWTEQLKDIGLKYLVVNNKSRAYINGDVLFPDEKIKSIAVEERHAFTCHAIQGETVKKSSIFIDIDDLFSVFQMLYVALSRVEYLDQIYIIQ